MPQHPQTRGGSQQAAELEELASVHAAAVAGQRMMRGHDGVLEGVR
jgi:hypothetical protein